MTAAAKYLVLWVAWNPGTAWATAITAGLLLTATGLAAHGWWAVNDRYTPVRDNPDDERPPRSEPFVRRPNPAVVYRHADTARQMAATELPRFPALIAKELTQ